MSFPEEYIKRGKFKLHGGEETDIFYDVNAILTDACHLDRIIKKIPEAEHYVGIATGGAVLAAIIADRRKKNYSMIKDNELKGKKPTGNYVLIDDVATTGSSLEEAIKIIGFQPEQIFVVVDRRKEKRQKLKAMFEVKCQEQEKAKLS